MDTRDILSHNMKVFMSNRSYDIAKLHKETGIARSTISRMLNGKNDRIDIEKIDVICAVLEIPVWFLFQNNNV